MSIRYKSLTEKEYTSLDIPYSFIPCFELKKRLIEREKIAMKSDFKFTITDETGTIEYKDEDKIMKNTCVCYKIDPLARNERDGIMAQIHNSGRPHRREPSVVAPPVNNAIYQVTPTNPVNSTYTATLSANTELHSPDEIPPLDYLCQRCLVSGHYEEYCPTQGYPLWPEKMKKWNFQISCGNPLERLKRIDHPYDISLYVKLGYTIVRHPEGNHHLCLVKREESNVKEKEVYRKVGTLLSICVASLFCMENSIIKITI